MNAENLLRLAAHIEAQPDELFDMSRVGAPECGTPGCILGHACELFLGMFGGQSSASACLALGVEIASRLRDQLFAPSCTYANYEEPYRSSPAFISKERAVRQLRYAAEHDKINWRKTP